MIELRPQSGEQVANRTQAKDVEAALPACSAASWTM